MWADFDFKILIRDLWIWLLLLLGTENFINNSISIETSSMTENTLSSILVYPVILNLANNFPQIS